MTRSASPALALFWSRVNVNGPWSDLLESRCWVWEGTTNGPAGYGLLQMKSSLGRWKMLAHRFGYEAAHGPIPAGLTVDHLCRNTLCVRPDHLEAVTQRVNILRGQGLTALHARKTHCPAGHEYTAENTRLHRTSRHCRTCDRDHQRRRRAELKAAA